MPSLTPQTRSDEATGTAFQDGLMNGTLALVPSSLAVWAAMKNPRFFKATNWQSRTALAIMPALFVFGLTSERKLEHSMKRIAAEESETSVAYQELARKHKDEELKKVKESIRRSMNADETETSVNDLYQKALGIENVRVVPGDKLAYHQQFANFWQENPFKILAGIGVPTVLYIFKGKAGQQHLPLQLKLMHTRVFGQFAVIGMLLTLMGFKGYMDSNGKYITETEAAEKINDVSMAKELLLQRVAHDRKVDEDRVKVIERAHESHGKAVRDPSVGMKQVQG